ncbi:hypothetical protein PROFUN_06068 [Planoprotostelium fungivorum]|uniref:Ricin B lectin domain-containing protein n=1 Tax=Planoprotostelium fungivorum TaxID=1890364 RepID=A0A2P6NPR0_9EUKA|nr:hypothetical protein PROFUN_06068 [Planoprotostelium fungivorum]
MQDQFVRPAFLNDRHMLRHALLFGALFVCLCRGYLFNISGAADDDLRNNFFIHPTAEYSWVGGDGTFSVDLGFGRTFFMWQDSWLGRAPYPNGWRALEGFTRNTVNIQNGVPQSRMSYHWNPSSGQNTGIVNAMDSDHWEWVAGGIMSAENKLHLLTTTVQGKDIPSIVQTHDTFHCIINPWDSPNDWKSWRVDFPVVDKVSWNTAISSPKDGWVYILGTKRDYNSQWGDKAIMSRMKESDMSGCNYNNRQCWGYAYGIPAWTSDCSRNNLIILYDTPSETTMNYNDDLQKWVSWQIPLVSREVWIYTADAPQGPWKGMKVYDMPQYVKDAPLAFAYHPKLHPMLSRSTNELLITFSTNAEEQPLQNTPWIYVPFPVRFNYKKIESGQNIVQAGSYTFRMKTNGYVLNANEDGTATSWYYFNQVWNVTISNGRYNIQSKNTNKCLTTRSLNQLSLENCDGSSSQRWLLLGSKDENFYYIVNDLGNQAVDFACKPDAGSKVATNVFFNIGYPCQKFTIERAYSVPNGVNVSFRVNRRFFNDRHMLRHALLFGALFVSLCRGYLFNISGRADDDLLNNFFIHPTTEYSWVGADGTFSVDLGFGRTFFMWQDTWLGRSPYPNGWRALEGFTRNTVNIQNGVPQSRMSYHWNPSSGQNTGIVNAMDSDHWEWVAGGILSAGSKLHLLASTVKGKDVASIVQTHYTFHCISNPWDSPNDWKYSRADFPLVDNIAWNDAISSPKDGWVYILGTKRDYNSQWNDKAVMSRMKESDMSGCNYNNRQCWGYAYGIPAWTSDCSRNNLIILYDTPSETTMNYNDDLQKWVSWQIPLVSREIWIYTADAPQGPWKGMKVYDMPQYVKDAPLYFAYHPKLHPMLSKSTNELLITFATNSDEKPLQNTPWIYVPFPVRFNYKKIESGQNIVQAGSYTFRMKTNGYVLNANADGTATSWYYYNQVWNVTISNGRYIIQSKNTNKCLTTRSLNQLSLDNCDGSSSQRWQLLGTKDENFYYIVNDLGNQAVDFACKPDAGSKVATNVFFNIGYPCQKFTIERV